MTALVVRLVMVVVVLETLHDLYVCIGHWDYFDGPLSLPKRMKERSLRSVLAAVGYKVSDVLLGRPVHVAAACVEYG
jgi:hypothetical protein